MAVYLIITKNRPVRTVTQILCPNKASLRRCEHPKLTIFRVFIIEMLLMDGQASNLVVAKHFSLFVHCVCYSRSVLGVSYLWSDPSKLYGLNRNVRVLIGKDTFSLSVFYQAPFIFPTVVQLDTSGILL